MPEITLRDLPLLAPPRSAWPRLAAELGARPARRAPRWIAGLAMAAALACAALLPRFLAEPVAPASTPLATAPSAPAVTVTPLQRLQAESAQLEALLAWSRNDTVELATFASLSEGLEQRVGRIDAMLARGDLDPEAAVPLWQERVLRLRQLLDLENTQQLLAARGDADPGAPVLAF